MKTITLYSPRTAHFPVPDVRLEKQFVADAIGVLKVTKRLLRDGPDGPAPRYVCSALQLVMLQGSVREAVAARKLKQEIIRSLGGPGTVVTWFRWYAYPGCSDYYNAIMGGLDEYQRLAIHHAYRKAWIDHMIGEFSKEPV